LVKKLKTGRRSLIQRDVERPVAALELLAGATWAWVVSAGIRRREHLKWLEDFSDRDVDFKARVQAAHQAPSRAAEKNAQPSAMVAASMGKGLA
jgi:hypothetical protein